MIKRTLKLIGGILAFMFIPYIIGYSVDYLYLNVFKDTIPMLWLIGSSVIAAAVLIISISQMMYNYIKGY